MIAEAVPAGNQPERDIRAAILRVGQPTSRLEDSRLLRGVARFIDDLQSPNQAYGCVVRSNLEHARLRRVATDAALAAPGVIAVLTGTNRETVALAAPARALPTAGRAEPLSSE